MVFFYRISQARRDYNRLEVTSMEEYTHDPSIWSDHTITDCTHSSPPAIFRPQYFTAILAVSKQVKGIVSRNEYFLTAYNNK